jgi:hypothetical protein
MRTLQEKYNGIQEGKFSKENFLADARKELPNLVTRFNGYDDAVQILKNRGMIQEAKIEEAKQPKPTKKGLADYRYKPTNEMDKYPYEQILRGLRVELETMGVQGTPTPEEYQKAIGKVAKNLEKDPIFYTNQIAGVNPNVDLHDQMVDATSKNTVDTFNGMKKAELKEGFKKLIKKVLSEEKVSIDDAEGENYKDEFEMYGEDAEYEGDPGYQGYESPSDRAMKSDAWVQAQRDMMEGIDTEADKNMVRKLMDMYETDPSKFEKLHKQAKVQADTTSGTQFNKLEMLFKRAKAGALQKATPEIPGFEGTRDALDNLFEESDEDKLQRYEQYTYTLNGETIVPDEIGFYNNYLGAELDGKFYKFSIPSEDGVVQLKSPQGKTGMYTENIFESVSLKDLL